MGVDVSLTGIGILIYYLTLSPVTHRFAVLYAASSYQNSVEFLAVVVALGTLVRMVCISECGISIRSGRMYYSIVMVEFGTIQSRSQPACSLLSVHAYLH